MVRVAAVAVGAPVAFASPRRRANTFPSFTQVDHRAIGGSLSVPVASYAPAPVVSAPVPSYAPTAQGGQSRLQGKQTSSRCWRILCYGDSLTAGFHDNGRRFSPYGNALREALTSMGIQCEVSICGLSGWRTDQMLAEISSPVCKDRFGKCGKGLAYMLDNDQGYDLVVLMAGTNDFTPNSNLKAIQSRISELHRVCHNRGVPTVMLGAPCNTHGLRIGLSKILQAWANGESNVMAFIDPEEVIPRSSYYSCWEPDQVHFSPAGSRTLGIKLASTVARVLQQLGDTSETLTKPNQMKSSPSIQGYRKVASVCVPVHMGQRARPLRSARGGA